MNKNKNNNNFKIGDKVRIKSWEQMVGEFGIDKDGNIETGFMNKMKYLCGKEIIVENVENEYWTQTIDDWIISFEMIELVEENKPNAKNESDEIFKETCRNILTKGDKHIGRPMWNDGIKAEWLSVSTVINQYDLSKEFPIGTLRPLNFKACIDEILWIYQKKSNNIKYLNSKIWDSWADENGSIGRAYGYQLGIKHEYSDGEYDQVDRILKDLKENPYNRRLISNIYNHADLHEMGLNPCCWSMIFVPYKDRLDGILNQRSNDVLVANNWNVCQYAILLHMFAQVSGFKVGTLTHVIADAHIYDRHIPLVEELISRESYKAPTLIINPDIDNFYNFKVEDFVLVNYEHGEQIKNIPVAI